MTNQPINRPTHPPAHPLTHPTKQPTNPAPPPTYLSLQSKLSEVQLTSLQRCSKCGQLLVELGAVSQRLLLTGSEGKSRAHTKMSNVLPLPF